jgi:surface polysaccharide O-acyltransferase-like enzyme
MSEHGGILMKGVEEEHDSYSLKNPERLTFLDSLRAVAILMVIGVHTLSYCVELPHDLKQIILFAIHTVSVPVFFLVDGYLFARSVILLKKYTYIKYVRSSLSRLLAPWVIFTLAYTLARYAFELTGFPKDKFILGHSLQEVILSAYGSVYAPQLYFLCSLFLIRLCAPFFKKVLAIDNYFVLLLLLCAYSVIYQLIVPSTSTYLKIEGGQEPILHALWGIQFYTLGIVIFMTSQIMDLRKLFIPFLLLSILVLLAENKSRIEGLNYVIQYLYLITMFLFFTFFQNGFHFLNVIGKNSMGIYLIHAPIVLKVTSLIANKFVLDPILSFLSILVGTFIISTSIAMIMISIPYGCLLIGIPYQKKGHLPVPR